MHPSQKISPIVLFIEDLESIVEYKKCCLTLIRILAFKCESEEQLHVKNFSNLIWKFKKIENKN